MPKAASSPTAPPTRIITGCLLLFFMSTTAIVGWQFQQTKHVLSSYVHGPISCQVFFSPDGGCTDAIVGTLAGAQKRVLVQAYSFTSKPIAEALLDVRKRGVDVRIILDKSQRTERYSEADFFLHMGIATFIDAEHAIAHNKIIIVDDATVITGSFNFTRAAEQRNAENLLVLHNADLAARYTRNWEEHLSHSEAYERR